MKKYKKSSELLGKKLMLYSAVLAGALTMSCVIISCDTNHNYQKEEEVVEISELDSVDDNQPILIIQKAPDGTEENRSLFVETDMDKVKKELYNGINTTDAIILEEDPDIKQEMIDDNISNYLNALQMVSEDFLIPEEKMEDYIMENYQLASGANMKHFYDDDVIIYNASAYKRIVDNNIDIFDALNEFNTLMALQANPVDLTEEEYNNLFPNLLKTIDLEKHENVYDIYYPLAYYLHRISCDAKEHHIDWDDLSSVHCENIDEEYQKIMK